MASGEVTCISREVLSIANLNESEADSKTHNINIPAVQSIPAKNRSRTQRPALNTVTPPNILTANPTSPSTNLKQSLLNFSPSPKPNKTLATRDVHNVDGSDSVIDPVSKCLSYDGDKSIALVANDDVAVKVETEAASISSLQTVQQSLSVLSPKSLKQSVLTVQTTEKVFKKPPSRRKEANRKRSQQSARHQSVDLPTSSERTKPQTRTKAVSVSPKKNTRLDTEQSGKENTQKTKYQTYLTAYGIRKTARQYAKEIEREREVNYLAALRNNVENGMKIIQTENKGRGIIATRPFYDGEFVVEYAGDLISEKLAKQREAEYKKDPNIGSYMFFFSHGGQRYCVDATQETNRLGRLINHSRLHPNCVVKVITIDGVPRLSLFARRPIAPGEELLYDYGDRDKESMISHPWLKT